MKNDQNQEMWLKIFSKHLWLIAKSRNSYLCHMTEIKMSSVSFQRSSKRKCTFWAFDQCLQIILDIALYVKELPLSLPQREAESKNSFWFVFYCCFCSGRWSKNYAFFLGHIAIFQPILKILS